MATVVNLAKDTRAAEVGLGVGQFLSRMKDRRLDKLQVQMMADITSAEDEAAASAIFGDPIYTEITGDPNRFAAMTTHYNNAPLGRQSITGYDAQGNQQIITISEQDDPAQALKDRGLTLERSRLFYAVDEQNENSIGRSLGRHAGMNVARDSLGEDDGTNITIMDQEEFSTHMQTKAAEIAIRQRQESIDLEQDKFDFNKNSPTTVFTSLIEDFENGKFQTVEQFNQAWDKLTFKGYGRLPDDVASETAQDMQERGAIIAAMSDQAVRFIEEVIAEPEIISKVGAIPRGLANISAELKASASLFGLTWENPNALEDFDFGGFEAHSTSFKNLLMDFAITYAATQGQTNRALSDKDFDRFLKIVGSDISNPEAFIFNMSQLMNKSQRAFNIMHNRLQGFPYEAKFGNFAKFEPKSDERRKLFLKALQAKYELDIPTGDN